MESKGWNNGLESEPVTTYVSDETKRAWKAHADEMDLSLSRFVETMVNAGRSQHSDSAPEGFDDPVSTEHEVRRLRRRLDEERGSTEVDALDVYAALGDGASVDDLSKVGGAEESEVYEALQRLVEHGLADYDPVADEYSRP